MTSRTKVMEFREGGRRFYAMVSPEGGERWAVQKYKSITPKTNFKFFNTFADENENRQLPGSDWDLNFSEENGKTKVSISIYNESLERMERIIADGGFKLGPRDSSRISKTCSPLAIRCGAWYSVCLSAKSSRFSTRTCSRLAVRRQPAEANELAGEPPKMRVMRLRQPDDFGFRDGRAEHTAQVSG